MNNSKQIRMQLLQEIIKSGQQLLEDNKEEPQSSEQGQKIADEVFDKIVANIVNNLNLDGT